MDEPMDDQEAPSTGAATAPDTPQRQRLRRRDMVALAAIAVLSCAAVVIARRHDSGGVEVVETGFSAAQPPYDMTYGVVVENRTDEIAYHTVACVELEMANGRKTGCERFTIEVLLPGQRVGFGALRRTPTDTGGTSGLSVAIEGPATWEDPDDHRWGPIVASNVDLAYSPENEPVVAFDQESGYEFDDVGNADAYAVLRDADGDIIGATGIEQDEPVRPHERVRRSIPFDAAVDDIATAEVYIFPSGL